MSAVPASARQEDGGASGESKGSSAPLLSQGPQDSSKLAGSTDLGDATKTRKRDFFKTLGKNKDEDKQKKLSSTSSTSSTTAAPQIAPLGGLRPASPMRSTDVGSPHRHPYASPGSPGHAMQGSPRPHSPASSMIFERNVQEDVAPAEASPGIPSHVITENHIPPALDASTEAITNKKIDPDTVEIITHATHQPASVTITGAGGIDHPSLAGPMLSEETLPSPIPHSLHRDQRHDAETGSNYGSLDSGDVRRLSFISFADVVHAEQEHGGSVAGDRRDSAHLSGPTMAPPRSPSPIRSPVSSAAFGTSPPTSVAASVKGLEASPQRAPHGTASPPLPGTGSPLANSELNIETMSQALRSPASGDLSGVRSGQVSAIGDGPSDIAFDRR